MLHLTYHRYLEHVGINEDYEAGYRSKETGHAWHNADPVKMQRNTLLESGVEEESIMLLEKSIIDSIDRSITKAASDPYPKSNELHEDIYA